MHYYQVHKNKKPKALRLRRKATPLIPILVMISAFGAAQLALIHSQQDKSGNKNKQVLITSLETTYATLKAARDERLRVFRLTGEYGKGTIVNIDKLEKEIQQFKSS